MGELFFSFPYTMMRCSKLQCIHWGLFGAVRYLVRGLTFIPGVYTGKRNIRSERIQRIRMAWAQLRSLEEIRSYTIQMLIIKPSNQ